MKSKITLEDLVTVGQLDYVNLSSIAYKLDPICKVGCFVNEDYLNDDFESAVFAYLYDKPVSFFKYDDEEITIYFEHDIYDQAVSNGEEYRNLLA